jgi:hypothetical protein
VQLTLLPKQVPVNFIIFDTQATDFSNGSAYVSAEASWIYDMTAPTGTAKFYAGGTYLGSASLDPNETAGYSTISAALDVSGLKPGMYPLTAAYSGDATHAEESYAWTPLYVDVHPSETWLEVSPPSAVQPGNVTLSGTVTDYWDSLTPTPGRVIFYVNGVATVSATTNEQGVATIAVPTSTMPPGIYRVYAAYQGDTSFGGSASGIQKVGVR